MNKAGSIKKTIAICMIFVLAFIILTSPLKRMSKAASAENDTRYIAETKLFIKEQGSIKDAKNWCEKQGDGWEVLEGDLNSGASGALTKEVGVFLCYKTTTDPDEAITDLAVMNEKGNYSEDDYKLLLDKQKEEYKDMVDDMKGMLDEYRANYKADVPTAKKAHDYLNLYKDDDSGDLLGDLLLTADEKKLTEVLLQANGLVVLTIQQQLASACDTARTTWLDRLSKIGSYDKLKKAFSKNVKSGNVTKALDMQYKEKALIILDSWDDIQKRIKNVIEFLSDFDMKNVTEEQFTEWLKSVSLDKEGFASFQEVMTLSALSGYKYGDKTLLEFFAVPREEIRKEGVEILYPMAASLTKGQVCALGESVGLFSLAQDALAANLYNDYDGSFFEKLLNRAPKTIKEKINETKKSYEDTISDLAKEEKISIYEGVDREIFGGGVAVTNDAKDRSKSDDEKWTGAFFDNGKPTRLSIGLGAGAAGSAILAVTFSIVESKVMTGLADRAIRDIASGGSAEFVGEGFFDLLDGYTVDAFKYMGNNNLKILKESLKNTNKTQAALAKEVYDNLTDSIAKTSTKWKIFNGLKWGFTVFAVLLSVVDVALTAYSIYKYYNVEHLPIPHHMVDLSQEEDKESSYVVYKSVRDQNDKCGDLNGGSAKQWLALYATKDKKAGEPILAPTDNEKMMVQTGSDKLPDTNYSPLHLFGTKNVPQNLTFADGDKGWSYNDKNKGTYLFFIHSDVSYNRPKEEANLGTAFGAGMYVVIGVCGVAVGFIIGMIAFGAGRRKRKEP